MAGSYNFNLFGANNVDDLTHEQYETIIAYEIYKSDKEREAITERDRRGRFKETSKTVSIRNKN